MTQKYKVVNETNGQILATKAIMADTPPTRAKGLLGRKNLETGEGLIIKPAGSIHTFFMKFPIDIIFLNSKLEILKISRQVKPFKMMWAPLNSKQVIELPAGTIDITETKNLHKLEIISVQSV